MMTETTVRLHWADCLLFAISLVLSLGVGLYHGCIKKLHFNADEFFLGGRQLGIVPVAISLFVSWLSALSLLSEPVEVYYYGAGFWYVTVGYVLGLLPIAFYFAPRFHEMKFISMGEFLEATHNKPFRISAACIGLMSWIPFVSVLLYAPSLAMEQATGIRIEYFIIVIGAVSIIYSTLGGLRGVVWADTLQMCILGIGYLAMLITTVVHLGGVGVVWKKAKEGGRTNLDRFSPNPGERSTFWTYVIDGFSRTFFPYMSTQVYVQRYLSVPTAKDAQLVTLLNIPIFVAATLITTLTGLTLFAYFGDCDPMVTGKVTRPDQMIPLMAMDVLGFLPGAAGLFLAGLVSAAMSSLSSCYNAMSTIMTKDVVEQIKYIKYKTELSDKSSTTVAKCSTVSVGLLVVCCAILIDHVKINLYSISLLLLGFVMGPQGGIVFLAFVAPWVDWISVLCGAVTALAVPGVIAYGAITGDPDHHRLSLYTCGCPDDQASNLTETIHVVSTAQPHFTSGNEDGCTYPDPPRERHGFSVDDIHNLSPMLYIMVAFLITVGVALICAPIVRKTRKLFSRGDINDNIAIKVHDLEIKDRDTTTQLL